jgi:site-specific recombinase XerD
VAAYIETLQRQAAPPTVKQHMAAIRMLFSWLTEKGVLAMNPAREVKTERFSRTEGKTPAFHYPRNMIHQIITNCCGTYNRTIMSKRNF